MNTTWTPHSRSADDLSTDEARRTNDEIWRRVQRGLVYPSPFAVFVTFFGRPDTRAAMTKERLGRIVQATRAKIHRDFTKRHTTAVVGVGFRAIASKLKEFGSLAA